MHKATYALLILVCIGSTATVCLALKHDAYRPSTALLACASATHSCYPPLVRNLVP